MSSRVVALARMQLFGLFGLNRLLHSEGGAERKKAAVLCAMPFAWPPSPFLR